jgi:hypothetical protein
MSARKLPDEVRKKKHTYVFRDSTVEKLEQLAIEMKCSVSTVIETLVNKEKPSK